MEAFGRPSMPWTLRRADTGSRPARDADRRTENGERRTEKNMNILDDAPFDAATHTFAVELAINDEKDGDPVRAL